MIWGFSVMVYRSRLTDFNLRFMEFSFLGYGFMFEGFEV